MILRDPEATDNDRFVAWMMLRNSVVSAEGKLPWCQDTGTAIVMAWKGGKKPALFTDSSLFDVRREEQRQQSAGTD